MDLLWIILIILYGKPFMEYLHFWKTPIYWGGKINISETNKQLKEAIGIYQ